VVIIADVANVFDSSILAHYTRLNQFDEIGFSMHESCVMQRGFAK